MGGLSKPETEKCPQRTLKTKVYKHQKRGREKYARQEGKLPLLRAEKRKKGLRLLKTLLQERGWS